MQIKRIFGYILIFCHRYLIPIVILYLLLYNFDFMLNLYLVVLSIVIIFLWYIFNGCALIPFENDLIDYHDSYSIRDKKTITLYDGKITMFEHVVYHPSTYLYLFFALGGVYKLYYIHNKRKMKH